MPGRECRLLLSCPGPDAKPAETGGAGRQAGAGKEDGSLTLNADGRSLGVSGPLPANASAVEEWLCDCVKNSTAAAPEVLDEASAELLSRRAGHFTLDADSGPQIDQLWVR